MIKKTTLILSLCLSSLANASIIECSGLDGKGLLFKMEMNITKGDFSPSVIWKVSAQNKNRTICKNADISALNGKIKSPYDATQNQNLLFECIGDSYMGSMNKKINIFADLTVASLNTYTARVCTDGVNQEVAGVNFTENDCLLNVICSKK